MILFWFILGIITILCISRYNEDEKLFWKLFISFIGAFTAATAVHEYISSKKKNKVEYVNSVPTQALYNGSRTYCVLADPICTVTYEVKTSDPVSKEYAVIHTNPILSKIAEKTRDQPCEYFDTS